MVVDEAGVVAVAEGTAVAAEAVTPAKMALVSVTKVTLNAISVMVMDIMQIDVLVKRKKEEAHLVKAGEKEPTMLLAEMLLLDEQQSSADSQV